MGITRARERLYVTRAATRVKRGKLLTRTPSRFLGDLPAGAWSAHDPNARDPVDAAARSDEVLAALRERLLRRPA